MTERARPKVGVALGGGATRGMAHIGVLQVLEDGGVPIDYVAGTSAGSIVGAIYCAGTSLKMLEKLTCQLDERQFFDVVRPRQGFLKGEELQRVICTLTSNKTFADTKVPFVAVACDLEKGEPVFLKEGKLHEAVRASISIPGVFVPMQKDGRMLVDGGLLSRTPIQTVREMGADYVIGVDVGVKGEERQVSGTIDIMLRMFEIMEWQITKNEISSAQCMIVPEVSGIEPYSMRQASECIRLGREAAERVLPDIQKALGITP